MDIFEKFKLGLQKTASSFSSGLKEIIIKKEIDDKTLDEIEEFLIQSDVGIIASEEIKKIIAEKKVDPNKNRLDEITPSDHEAFVHVSLTDDHPWAQAYVVIEARPLA